MANYTSWRKVPGKKVLDYANQVGDEQAAAEFCINVNKIKGLRMNPSETVTINGYTQPEKLKILAKADEVGDAQASDEFKVSKNTIAKWRKKLKASKVVAESIPETQAIPETKTISEPVLETFVKPENVVKLDAITETFEEESADLDLRQKLILENKILTERLEVATRQLNAMKSAILSLL